jgi:NitT/TauT family transport system substrate-binding protein
MILPFVSWFVTCLFLLLLPLKALAVEPAPIRLGLVKYGTVAWEADTIRYHKLDQANGITLSVTEFATNEAAKVALQAQAVDLIVTDWPWVNRQRAEGASFSFAPYSRAVGALLVAPQSKIASLADLKGKRIGIAGGPLDKSFLLLRALFRKTLGADLIELTDPIFGAPPLLNEELAQGRIDAVLTYWHYAARLEAQGAKPILTVAGIIQQLGSAGDTPMLGYAFLDDWAKAHQPSLEGFLKASQEAKQILATSDEEWQRLTPLLGTDNPKIRMLLRQGYRAGILEKWGDEERRSAALLYNILVELGGERLVGPARTLDPATFWPMAPD